MFHKSRVSARLWLNKSIVAVILAVTKGRGSSVAAVTSSKRTNSD